MVLQFNKFSSMSDRTRKGPLCEIILDEIALEGLEGITLEGLWVRLSVALGLPVPFHQSFKDTVWTFILKSYSLLSFYELPTSRSKFKFFDRTIYFDNNVERITDDECVRNTYKWNPIDKDGVRGSCECYDERKEISVNKIKKFFVSDIEKRWNNKFVIVGSQALREKALFLPNAEKPNLLIIPYCVLEIIARSRYNGELTAGNNSLLSYVKDSALVFYVRAKLLEKNLITKQAIRETIKGRCLITSLLHLKRFYVEIRQKHQQIFENVCNLLKSQPNYMMSAIELKKQIPGLRKVHKNEIYQTYLEYLKLPYRAVYPNATEKEWKIKKFNVERELMVYRLKDPKIVAEEIQLKENELVKDDDDDQDYVDVRNQYIDMPLQDQIYKAIERYGAEGCSQTDLRKYLGLAKYQIRKIMKDMAKHKLVSTFLKDRGKQRIWVYVINSYAKTHAEKVVIPNAGDLIKSLKSNTAIIATETISNKTSTNDSITTISCDTNISTINNNENDNDNENNKSIIINESKCEDISLSPGKLSSEISLPSSQESQQQQSFKTILDKNEVIVTYSDVIGNESNKILNEEIQKLPSMKIKIIQVARRGTIDSKTKLTTRQIERINMIVNTINEKLIIEISQLYRTMITNEKSLGYHDQLCRKSLLRSINWLTENQVIKFYEILYQLNDYTKTEKFVCHRSITSNNLTLQNEIKRTGNAFFVYVADKFFHTKIQNYKENISGLNSIQSQQLLIQHNHKKGPRFIRARHFHELLFYLVYEQERLNLKKALMLDDKVIESWLKLYPNLNLTNLKNKLPDLYSDTIDFKMFLPPVPDNYDEQKLYNGWIYLEDIWYRLPLSIVLQIFVLDKEIDNSIELQEYANHPILCHIPITLLPLHIQGILGTSKLLHNPNYDDIIKVLCVMGLIKVAHRNELEPKKIWIYVNRYSTLLDTAISDEGYDEISKNKDYDEVRFTFHTFYDIQNYWNTLYQISLCTKLGFKRSIGRQIKRKRRDIPDLPTISLNEANENDKGYLPGDKLGAGGLDASLYAHIRKNWTKYTQPRSKHDDGNDKIIAIRQDQKEGVRLRLCKVAYKVTTRDRKIATIKRKKITPDYTSLRKKIKLSLCPSKKIISTTVKKTSIKVKKYKKAKREYDAIDIQALKRMQKLRTTWTPEEDEILLFCRTIYTYWGHPFIHRVVNSYTIRDILHWSCGEISLNKTSLACQRRTVNLLKTNTKARSDISSWVFELRQNKFINQRFGENFIQDLRKVYSDNDIEYGLAMRIYFVQMVYYLKKIIKCGSIISELPYVVILPSTLNQFKRFYIEAAPAVKCDQIRYYDPNSIEDIEISTINLIIHSSVCCFKDKTLYNVQLFDIYKTYKEETLTKAFKQAKDDHLIIQIRKRNAASNSSSAFGLSSRYKLQLYLSIPYHSFDEFHHILKESFSKLFEENLKDQRFIEFSSVNSGGFFYLADLLNHNNTRLEIQLPKKVLTIDPQQSSCGESEKILDHFRKMFENAPKVDYSKILESTYKDTLQFINNKTNMNSNAVGESSSSVFSQRKIKFNFADDTYSLSYNPYDVIIKLGDEYLHFFCALSKLNKIINLNLKRIFDSTIVNNNNNLCPFNDCILIYGNYINEIEKIVCDNKETINILARHNEIDDDDDDKLNGKILITTENLLQIFFKFQHIYKLRNEQNDKKDFGKLSLQRSILDMISLTKELLEYQEDDTTGDGTTKSCEYEATLNKEEKIARMQDVFVVNIPKLRITFDSNDENDNFYYNFITYNGLKLPGHMKELCSRFNEILEQIRNDAIWSAQDSNLNIDLHTEMEKNSNFTSKEKNFAKEILNFIKQNALGATSTSMRLKFLDEDLLVKCVNILRQCRLVMRTGIEQWTYVHRDYIKPWVIHSYHIKRLEKESIDPKSNINLTNKSEKRKRKLQKSNDESEPLNKTMKLTEIDIFDQSILNKKTNSASTSKQEKRVPKSVERYDRSNNSKCESTSKNREIIVLRPYPWIRVNGSINRRVLDKWLGSILLECIHLCGLTIKKLFIRFNYLHPVCILYLLEVLQKLGCVKLKTTYRKKLTLFSKYAEIEESDANEFSDLDSVFILVEPHALNNLTLFIGERKYKNDFI